MTVVRSSASSGSASEVHRLHGILENFLRFACVQDLKLEAVDLNEIVEEICDFYEHSCRDEVDRHADPACGRSPSDPA